MVSDNEKSLSNQKHIIPKGLVGINFSNENEVQIIDIPYQQAKEIKKRIDADFEMNYPKPGHKKWIFNEFDQNSMIFWVANYRPNPTKNLRPWATYIAENIYRVERSNKAEAELNVDKIIQLYETGAHGIKAGMTKEEVIKILGNPKEIRELGPFGSFDFIYDDLEIRFIDNRAAFFNNK